MAENEKTNIVLMVQSTSMVFCYFNISPIIIKEFEDRYGQASWKNSKLVIKVYCVESGIAKEMKTIFIDDCINSCYINIDRGDKDIFIKLGRVLPDNTFNAFAVSNTVTTPRSCESENTSVYFIDVSQNVNINSKSNLPTFEEYASKLGIHKEPKPYPFMNDKKKWSGYPKIMINSSYCKNDFFNRYFDEIVIKYDLCSSPIK